MSNASNTPPSFDPVVQDNGKVNLSWLLYFNNLSDGDVGQSWVPTFTGLTEVGGAATITGAYYQILKRLCFFRFTITPVTNTSSVSGTTYVDNFPLISSNNGFCVAITGTTGSALGTVISSSNRIYMPSWSLITTPITVIGFVEVTG